MKHLALAEAKFGLLDELFSAPIGPPAPRRGTLRKASVMGNLRQSIDQRVTPQIRSSVARVLQAQREDIVARVRGRYDEIKRKPHDTSLWWKAPNGQRDPWNAAMTAALEPHLTQVAQTVVGHVRTVIPQQAGKADLAAAGAVAYVLTRGAARVTGINETTRNGIQEIIAQALSQGMGPAELGDAIEAWSGWDEYRAERIATTELMDAYNSAALGSYAEMGVTEVQAIDGHGDPECLERDGQVYPIDEAAAIEDHPNGTLDWTPVIPEPKAVLIAPLSSKARTIALIERMQDSEDEERQQIGVLMKAVLEMAAREIVIPAPLVDVKPPEVVVNVAPPEVVVQVPEQKPLPPRTKRVIRDELGDIVSVIEE